MNDYPMIPTGISASQIASLQDIYKQYIGYKTDGYFVEIGAFDGYSWSNTACLVAIGWSGIMVEPNPESFAKLSERYHENPKLILENVAIGRYNRLVKLYLGGSLTTTRLKSVRDYPEIQGMNFTGLDKKNYIHVPMYTMNRMLSKNGCPKKYDVLVIDVEGAELSVLWNYQIDRWTPSMVIIETHELHPDERLNWKAKPINSYFTWHGYEKIYSDIINSIYWSRS